MGSCISLAIGASVGLMQREWEFADEDDPYRGPFLHELPLDQRNRLVKRWMERLDRKSFVSHGRQSEKDIALPHVQSALHHYNSNNPGARYELVQPMKCNCVGFRDEIWFHVNFLARPRKKRNYLARRRNTTPDTALQYFFAELHYGCSDTPVVETCFILEKPLSRCKQKCAFCKVPVGILHPSNGEVVCGRPGQKKDYYKVCMWRRMPKKYMLLPEEDPTSVKKLFDELPLAA